MIYNSYLAKSDQLKHPLNIDYLQEPGLFASPVLIKEIGAKTDKSALFVI